MSLSYLLFITLLRSQILSFRIWLFLSQFFVKTDNCIDATSVKLDNIRNNKTPCNRFSGILGLGRPTKAIQEMQLNLREIDYK